MRGLSAWIVVGLLALVSSDAQAFLYFGNPGNLSFRVDRPADDYLDGSVYLTKVRMQHCAGGYTDYAVNQTIDPVAGYSLSIGPGDECYATYFWGSTMDIDGPTYTVRYSQPTTTVALSGDIAPASLSPYSVLSGTMSGGGPWLMMVIE
jgi:hypothetical protein